MTSSELGPACRAHLSRSTATSVGSRALWHSCIPDHSPLFRTDDLSFHLFHVKHLLPKKLLDTIGEVIWGVRAVEFLCRSRAQPGFDILEIRANLPPIALGTTVVIVRAASDSRENHILGCREQDHVIESIVEPSLVLHGSRDDDGWRRVQQRRQSHFIPQSVCGLPRSVVRIDHPMTAIPQNR